MLTLATTATTWLIDKVLIPIGTEIAVSRGENSERRDSFLTRS